MNTFRNTAGIGILQLGKQGLAFVLSLALLFVTLPPNLSRKTKTRKRRPRKPRLATAQGGQAPAYAQQTPEQLQRLVAPIALYPDSLVAQILAASTFPDEVVEADRWVQAHPDLKGDALGKAVDQQPWDPSVKALTAFPSVLGNMDKNLSWTSSLGDAYYNQQQDVMDAIQVMRHKAQAAGNLKTRAAEVVKDEGPTIDIEPAEPGCGLCSGIRSVADLRISHRGLAGMVSVSWNLVWRPVFFVRTRLRNRLVRRLWLGLGTLGIRLASRVPNLWRRQIFLAQQNVL